MKTLKAQEVYLGEYRTLGDVQSRLPYFIEQGYNRTRRHAALGYYRPPEEFETLWMAAQMNQSPCRGTLTQTVQT